jgi:hypothetical protein
VGDLHILDLKTLTWSEADAQGGLTRSPVPQLDAALAWARGRLYIFAGDLSPMGEPFFAKHSIHYKLRGRL